MSMEDRFMKDFNGEKVFSLEYDKETLRDMVLEKQEEIERLNKALQEIKNQLDYLETYSNKEDVFEDMKRRLDNIESIVNKTLGSDKE